jgi:diguanylate cyclase (GGDEF)-like protein/PAS domain S-box-containing protein
METQKIDLLLIGTSKLAKRMRAVLDAAGDCCRLKVVSTLVDAQTELDSPDSSVILSELKVLDGTVLDVASLVAEKAGSVPLVIVSKTGAEALALQCQELGIGHWLSTHQPGLRRLPGLIRLLVRARKSSEQHLLAEMLHTSDQRYRDLFDNTSDLVQCLSARGRFLYTNKAWRDIMGYSEEELKDLQLTDVLHSDSLACCTERFERLKKGEILSGIDFKYVTRSGDIVYLNGECGSVIRDGEAVSTRGIFRNVTEERKAEAALKASEVRYQQLYENAPDINSTINARGEILSINRIGASLLGYQVEELVGVSALKLIHPDDQETVMAYYGKQFGGSVGADADALEYRNIRKDGTTLWVQQRVSLSLEVNETEPCLLVVSRDITETRKLSEQLVYQATHDELTELVNRREFERRLSNLLASPDAGEGQHALCYLDLDQFKVINDTCGHTAGDELLRQISHLIAGLIRSRDTLARLGGDEFAVIMEHCPLQQAAQLAERIRAAIEDFRFYWHAQRFAIGVSIGVVPVGAEEKSLQQLLSMADTACYAAKDRGRNRVYVCGTGDVGMLDRVGDMRWVSSLNQALEKDMFRLFAQPIVSCKAASAGVRIEVLLRLKDSNGLIVTPGEFLPAAERYGVSNRIDRWVLESVIHWFEQHPDEIVRLEMCCINLSGLSLSTEAFLVHAIDLIRTSSFPGHKLCFEITETAAISNLERAVEFMNTLKREGCRFALDDFGSGLSSFAYLKNLPVDFLKIDGSFVRDIVHSDVDRAMVKSICEVGALMGKKTTAEYVESADAHEIVQDFGVDYVQGYHLGKPRPIEQILNATPLADYSVRHG